MNTRLNSILDTIGHTPVVKINNLGPDHVHLYAKIEAFNPMGSVKDRLALGVIEAAERSGELQPGQTVIEATSGNTGIGLAMVCAQKGYPLVVTMAENFSVERRKLMRFLGAKVVLTPAHEKGSGMVSKSEELAEKHGWWQSRQFENPANADMHARTTAPEILQAFADVGLDYWVTGFGTGGTLNGVSRVMKARSPDTKIVVCEPDNAQLLASGIQQPEHGSHPNFRPHLMQGWTPDFISKLTAEVEHIDSFMPIDGHEAMRCSQELASKEGILVGITAGATFYGALKVAEQAPEGAYILCMLPDTGERYLSTPLFEDIPADMTDEELAISRSTPGYRFDQTADVTPEAVTPVELDPATQAEVETMLHDTDNPVLMYSLEWCEFCWSVRKVFAAYGIPFKAVDLDSVEYQADNRGGKIRDVLKDRTGWNTLPLIFIDGEFIGGCTDLFDGLKEGRTQQQLSKASVAFNQDLQQNPYDMLPKWLHPR